jgi:hypothetical protein
LACSLLICAAGQKMTGRALGGESFLIKAVVAAGVTTRDRYMPDFIQKLAKELPMIRPAALYFGQSSSEQLRGPKNPKLWPPRRSNWKIRLTCVTRKSQGAISL